MARERERPVRLVAPSARRERRFLQVRGEVGASE